MTDMAPEIRSFQVERCPDNVNFYPIITQDARNTTGTKEYSFYDNGFLPGVNYYRLKMIEVGDVVRYSPVIRIFTGEKNDRLIISPNPTSGNFAVQYNAKEAGPVTIRISDINGRQVSLIHESVNKGQNLIYIQSKPSWISGMYLVSVQYGSDVQQGKLILSK
jgi:hypothetical protein